MATIDDLKAAIDQMNADMVLAITTMHAGLVRVAVSQQQTTQNPVPKPTPSPKPYQPPSLSTLLGPVVNSMGPGTSQFASGLSMSLGPTLGSLGNLASVINQAPQGLGFGTSTLTGMAGSALARAIPSLGSLLGGGGAATGAAAGGAGAAGAAGGAAALASNPVGWAIALAAASAAVTAAFVAMPSAIKRFTESLLEGQRHLADVSGAMASVMAHHDVRNLMRDVEKGNRIAPTAAALAQAQGDLADATMELEVEFEKLKLNIGTWLAKGAKEVADPSMSTMGIVAGGLIPGGAVVGWGMKLGKFFGWIDDNLDPKLSQILGGVNEVAGNTAKAPVQPVAEWLHAIRDEALEQRKRKDPAVQWKVLP